jgi:hypothetical protein
MPATTTDGMLRKLLLMPREQHVFFAVPAGITD